jgi:hypothetical protein
MTTRAIAVLLAAGCGGARQAAPEAPADEPAVVDEAPAAANAPALSTGGTWLCAWPALDECRTRCADGNALSCARLARLLEPTSSYMGDDADPAAAREALERSCELGYGIACGKLATDALIVADDNPDERARGRALLARACDLEVAWACTKLSHDAERGESYRLLRRACELGDQAACRIATATSATPIGGANKTDVVAAYLTALSGGPIPSPRAKAVVTCGPGTIAVYAQITPGVPGPETYCAQPDGTRDGVSITWASEEDLTEGPAHGVALETGTYLANLRNGIFTFRYTTGAIAGKGEYIDDLEVGRWQYFAPDGALREAGTYVAGVRDGVWTERDGDRERTGPYRAGVRSGLWTESVAGAVVRRWTYAAGEEVLTP